MDIQLYVTEDDKRPFVTWIKKLKDAKGRGVINARVARLRLDNFGDCKPVGDGVWELHIDFGPGYRVYYGQADKQLVLLLCGGDKDTQNANITIAKRYWADCKLRVADEKKDSSKGKK